MLKEFKEFIQRGSVLDMAVGVILGAAFKAIVDVLVEGILMPLVGAATAGINFDSWVVTVAGVDLAVGMLISKIISFLIVAFILFLIIKAFNKMHREEEPVEEAPTTKECPYCKTEIALDATRCPHCTSELK